MNKHRRLKQIHAWLGALLVSSLLLSGSSLLLSGCGILMWPFQLLGSFTPSNENRLEYCWVLLWNRSFNSLRWAYYLLNTGYYSQSLMLTRGAFEDWLVCEDIKTHPETVECLISNEGRFPRFQTMANRLEDPLKREWNGTEEIDGTYGLLSSLSHPRHRSLVVLLDPDTHLIRLGPAWDEAMFIVGANYLLLALIRMVEFLMMLVSDNAKDWGSKELKPSIDEAMECQELLLSRAKMLPESQSG